MQENRAGSCPALDLWKVRRDETAPHAFELTHVTGQSAAAPADQTPSLGVGAGLPTEAMARLSALRNARALASMMSVERPRPR